LPGQRGTKKEIFSKIESIYNIKLENNDSTYKTLSQSLSKYFNKSPQEYMLKPGEDFSKFNLGNHPCMKQMIIQTLLRMKERRGDIKQIKAELLGIFGDRIRNEYVDKTSSSSNL
jgi:hypothetical protein